jgi:hypothetical protein
MLFVALFATACAVTLVACGGSGRTGYHNPSYRYGAPNLAISMSRCMRANGVPEFPDPREGPNGGGVGWVGGLMITGTGTMVVEGVSLSGPAFVSAEKVCKEYMPPSGPPPAVSEGQRVTALAQARCMREHGLPNFPDPTFSAGGGIDLNFGPGLNQQSPVFRQAAQKCGSLKP